MFDINHANVPTKCQNCRKDIPPKTDKLRFQKLLGSATVNGSLCFKCLTALLKEKGLTLIKKEEQDDFNELRSLYQKYQRSDKEEDFDRFIRASGKILA